MQHSSSFRQEPHGPAVNNYETGGLGISDWGKQDQHDQISKTLLSREQAGGRLPGGMLDRLFYNKVALDNLTSWWFLRWAGLLTAPRDCPSGHEWLARARKSGAAFIKCLHRGEGTEKKRDEATLKDLQDKRGNKRGPKPKDFFVQRAAPCGAFDTWWRWCPLAQVLPEMQPQQLIIVIKLLTQRCSLKQIQRQSCLGKHSLRETLAVLRQSMLIDLLPSGKPDELMGEQGRVVVVDEAKIVKVRYNSGGFVGSSILGNDTWVMVGIELDREEMPRYETGRCFAVIIPDRTYESFRAALLPRLAKGCKVWTDGHASYDVLDDSGFIHEKVMQARAESLLPCVIPPTSAGGEGGGP